MITATGVTDHALDRYRLHNSYADVEMAMWSIQYGDELDGELVAVLTQNAKRGQDGGRYVLSKSSEGWGIWVVSDEGVAITYLRLGPAQIKVLGGDPNVAERVEEYVSDVLPNGAMDAKLLTDGTVEFMYRGFIVRMIPSPKRGDTIWSWSVKPGYTAKGIASGWADKDLALKMLTFTVQHLSETSQEA